VPARSRSREKRGRLKNLGGQARGRRGADSHGRSDRSALIGEDHSESTPLRLCKTKEGEGMLGPYAALETHHRETRRTKQEGGGKSNPRLKLLLVHRKKRGPYPCSSELLYGQGASRVNILEKKKKGEERLSHTKEQKGKKGRSASSMRRISSRWQPRPRTEEGASNNNQHLLSTPS